METIQKFSTMEFNSHVFISIFLSLFLSLWIILNTVYLLKIRFNTNMLHNKMINKMLHNKNKLKKFFIILFIYCITPVLIQNALYVYADNNIRFIFSFIYMVLFIIFGFYSGVYGIKYFFSWNFNSYKKIFAVTLLILYAFVSVYFLIFYLIIDIQINSMLIYDVSILLDYAIDIGSYLSN